MPFYGTSVQFELFLPFYKAEDNLEYILFGILVLFFSSASPPLLFSSLPFICVHGHCPVVVTLYIFWV